MSTLHWDNLTRELPTYNDVETKVLMAIVQRWGMLEAGQRTELQVYLEALRDVLSEMELIRE